MPKIRSHPVNWNEILNSHFTCISSNKNFPRVNLLPPIKKWIDLSFKRFKSIWNYGVGIEEVLPGWKLSLVEIVWWEFSWWELFYNFCNTYSIIPVYRLSTMVLVTHSGIMEQFTLIRFRFTGMLSINKYIKNLLGNLLWKWGLWYKTIHRPPPSKSAHLH